MTEQRSEERAQLDRLLAQLQEEGETHDAFADGLGRSEADDEFLGERAMAAGRGAGKMEAVQRIRELLAERPPQPEGEVVWMVRHRGRWQGLDESASPAFYDLWRSRGYEVAAFTRLTETQAKEITEGRGR